MQVARFAARLVVGALFVGHGTQKLMGWFGGPGLAGTDQMMKSLGMHPPRRNSLAAGCTETAGGVLVAAGLATPLAASALIGVMTTAIRKVHWSNGVWSSQGGYEYNLTLISLLATVAEAGPGQLSLDHAFGMEKSGLRWALGAVSLGVAASFVTTEIGRRAAERSVVPDEAEPDAGASGANE